MLIERLTAVRPGLARIPAANANGNLLSVALLPTSRSESVRSAGSRRWPTTMTWTTPDFHPCTPKVTFALLFEPDDSSVNG